MLKTYMKRTLAHGVLETSLVLIKSDVGEKTATTKTTTTTTHIDQEKHQRTTYDKRTKATTNLLTSSFHSIG